MHQCPHNDKQKDSLQHILFDYSLNISLKEYFRRRQDGLKLAVKVETSLDYLIIYQDLDVRAEDEN
jgi:hypothetical protein